MNKSLYIPFTFILAVLILFITASCAGDEQSEPANPTRVLLVYIGVDNNLTGYESEKLQALQTGWTGKSTDHILAYVDAVQGGAALYELSVPSVSEPFILAEYGKENSASPATLKRVIDDVISTYPANSYGLLVFSHAIGWLPQGYEALPITTRSIITDGTSEMELSDFAAAIPDGIFDYIAFEACFMAGIEVAYELRHKTKSILASSAEIIHPGFAPVYATSTHKLLSGNLTGFAQDAFDQTLTYSNDNILRSATYSVIRTTGLEALATFIKANCDFTPTEAITPADIQHFDRQNNDHVFFDFANYYSSLLHTDAQRIELDKLISDCVVWKAATDEFMTQQPGYNGFSIKKHSGLTTYIPQPALPELNAAYSGLTWKLRINL